MPIVLDIRLKIPLAPVPERISAYGLPAHYLAIFLIGSNAPQVHVRQGISRSNAGRVAEAQEALGIFVDIGRRVDVVKEQKETGFHRVRAVRPDEVVLDGGLRIRVEEPETRWTH